MSDQAIVMPSSSGGWPFLSHVSPIEQEGEEMASWRPATLINLNKLLASQCFGNIRWDEFVGAEVIDTSEGRILLDDAALTSLAIGCEMQGLKNVRPSILKKVVHAIAKANPFDSMKEWLFKLPSWDGIARVERFLPDYLGTQNRDYEREVGRFWWTAMISRILVPGHKVDMVPILVGKQGVGKTKLLENISPTLEQYGDVRLTDRPAELALKVLGKVLVSWEELRGIRGRADADEVKTFITNRYIELRSRTKSGMDQHLRRFVIVGTSNRKDFLRDATGHRRYLPFDVSRIDLERLKGDKLQLWAEALHIVGERQRTGRSLVDFEEAERLAAVEHQRYIDQARWVDDGRLLDFIRQGNIRFSTADALKLVGVITPTRPDRTDMKRSLEQLGMDFRSTYMPGQSNRPKTWQWASGSAGLQSLIQSP